MSINFIFGNLDKQGKLEKDDQVAAVSFFGVIKYF
jgi:hypothetical protein